MELDRDHLAGEHRRLAARGGAEVEHALAFARADDEAGELGASALRPDPSFGQRPLVDPLDAVGAGDVSWLAVDLPTYEPHDGLQWLVLRLHQRDRLLAAEVTRPDFLDPVGIRLLQRPFRERGE